ncbi:hypothetical protein evm_002266 [Chilo suppressalis]|nr:hypothetical protein evm_002266 [Chilo suppressalis]
MNNFNSAPDMKVNSPPCHSPGAILPDLPQPAEEPDKYKITITRIEPRLTIYVCPATSDIYSVLYLHACRARELLHKLHKLLDNCGKDCETVLVSGPNGARVRLTDELVRHLPDNSTYRLERIEEANALLLSATSN